MLRYWKFTVSGVINDHYNKDVRLPEGSDFPECQSWKESSCCTCAVVKELRSRKTLGSIMFLVIYVVP